MNATRHLYAIGGILTILTAASFGTGRFKSGPASTNVIVSNSNAQGVPFKEVGKTPITVEIALPMLLGSGGSGYQALYTVPAGKRLIIQTMYGMGQSNYGTPIGLGAIKVVSGATIHTFPLPFESKQVSDPQTGENEYVLSNVTLDVEPGSVMTAVVVLQNYDSAAYASVGFSGYLENAS